MDLEKRALCWGIIGCGKIAFDFCIALQTLSKDKHTIHHVAARSISKAKEFGERFNAVHSSGCYEDVVNDKEVDVVYIGTINPTHAAISMLAMNAGKAVLCEKPVAMNMEELNEMLECAKNNNVFFMEALWTRCFPLYIDMLSKIKEGKYGDVNVVQVEFGIEIFNQVARLNTPELGGSALLDIGVYNLHMADMCFGGKTAKKLYVAGHIDVASGLDRSQNITLLYEGTSFAQLLSDADHKLDNRCVIRCTGGVLTVEPPYWCPTKYIFVSNTGEREVKEFLFPKCEPTNFKNSVGLRYEAQHVRDCLLKGQRESDIVPHSTSCRVLTYMDEARKQLGVYV